MSGSAVLDWAGGERVKGMGIRSVKKQILFLVTWDEIEIL